MSASGKTRYAVLGMIGLGLRTGYDIKKYTEEVMSHFWRESYGNLYPVLKRLESEGRVTHHTEQREGRPPRQVYQLTEEGQRELEAWLQEVAQWEAPRQEVLLKLLFSGASGSGLGMRHVLTLRSSLVESRRQRQGVQHRSPEDPEGARRFRLTLRFAELVEEAMLTWCDEAMAALREPLDDSSPAS